MSATGAARARAGAGAVSRLLRGPPGAAQRGFASKPDDVRTHTGQKWDSQDYRMVRFTNAPKHVNQQWAIKLIEEVPPKEVSERVVWCDGGSGPEGHPRVYINLDKPGNHSCGYCGLRFVMKAHH